MNYATIPNIITLFRLILVFPLLGALLYGEYPLAFGLFLVAGASDGIDGLLARRYGWTSYFGSIADPFADKLLIMSCFMVLTWLGDIPVWLLILVLGRDLFIMVGVVVLRKLIGPYEFTPSYISKINTVFQILLITLLLFQLAFAYSFNSLTQLMLYAVTITTASSFLDYLWVWGKRAWIKS